MLELTSLVGVNITGCMGHQQVANVAQCCCTSLVSKVTMKKATSF
jgi:glycerol kinase